MFWDGSESLLVLLLLSVQHQQDPGRHCLLDGEDSLPGVLDSGDVAGGPVHGVSHLVNHIY